MPEKNPKGFAFKSVGPAITANNFPDILWFAGAAVAKKGDSAKFRIQFKLGPHVSKRWVETVQNVEAGGTAFGNLFDGYLVKRDDADYSSLTFKAEVDTRSGYKELTIVGVFAIGDTGGPAKGEYVLFDDGQGHSAVLGYLLLLA